MTSWTCLRLSPEKIHHSYHHWQKYFLTSPCQNHHLSCNLTNWSWEKLGGVGNPFPWLLPNFHKPYLYEIIHVSSTWIEMLILSPSLEKKCLLKWFHVLYTSKYPILLWILCLIYPKLPMGQIEFCILLAQIGHFHETFKNNLLRPTDFSSLTKFQLQSVDTVQTMPIFHFFPFSKFEFRYK